MTTQDTAIAAEFQAEFAEMWTEHKFGVKKLQELPKIFRVGESRVTVQFSPFSGSQVWEVVHGLIGATLNTARESVNLALFVFICLCRTEAC